MKTPRRYAPMGGSFAAVWVAGFKWNGWQTSVEYTLLPLRGKKHRGQLAIKQAFVEMAVSFLH